MASKQYEIAFQIGGKLQASLSKSITTAAGQLDLLGQKISHLEKAQGTSNRFRALHNEIDATKLKLRQAEAELGKLDREMRATSAPTAQLSRQFADAQAKVAALRLQFRGEVTELKAVKSAMAAAGIGVRTFAADNAKLAAALTKAQAAQKRMRENAGARAENQKNLEVARSKFDKSKGRVLGAAAGVATWVIPVKIAADFEDSMIRAGALAKATDAQLATLTDTARKLGRDTRFSATQAATGMQYLAQSGFKVDEILSAMPGMLDIAAAGAVELGEAADITSNILRGFGMQAGESGRLGDVLTNTFTNSSTNLSMLGETMKYVAPIAKATGVSLETTAAAAGLLGTAGIKGEQAGTALRAMLSRLAAPVHKGAMALAKLGVKTKDAHGNLRPLADIMVDISKKMSKYGSATRQGMTTAIFGMEAATAATVLLGEAGSGNLQRFTKMVGKQGTAAAIAAKQNASMKGQWDNFYGSIEDVAIQIGTTMIPILKRLIDKMVPVINAVTTWLQAHPRLTDAIVLGGAALTTLVLVLTVAAVAFNGAKVAMIAAQGAMLLMNVATWKAVAAWTAANLPIMACIAGIGGLIYAGAELRKEWKAVEEWWDGMWDSMFDSVADVVNGVTPALRALGFNVQDMDKGVLTRARYRQRLFADFAKQPGANFQPWSPAPDTPDAGPTWLKKADKLGGGPSAKRGGDTYSQTINLPPGTPANVRADIEKAMAEGRKGFEAMMKRRDADASRLALE